MTNGPILIVVRYGKNPLTNNYLLFPALKQTVGGRQKANNYRDVETGADTIAHNTVHGPVTTRNRKAIVWLGRGGCVEK